MFAVNTRTTNRDHFHPFRYNILSRGASVVSTSAEANRHSDKNRQSTEANHEQVARRWQPRAATRMHVRQPRAGRTTVTHGIDGGGRRCGAWWHRSSSGARDGRLQTLAAMAWWTGAMTHADQSLPLALPVAAWARAGQIRQGQWASTVAISTSPPPATSKAAWSGREMMGRRGGIVKQLTTMGQVGSIVHGVDGGQRGRAPASYDQPAAMAGLVGSIAHGGDYDRRRRAMASHKPWRRWRRRAPTSHKQRCRRWQFDRASI
jgi:hypothetical protein